MSDGKRMHISVKLAYFIRREQFLNLKSMRWNSCRVDKIGITGEEYMWSNSRMLKRQEWSPEERHLREEPKGMGLIFSKENHWGPSKEYSYGYWTAASIIEPRWLKKRSVKTASMHDKQTKRLLKKHLSKIVCFK